jgi:hypothetical protein
MRKQVFTGITMLGLFLTLAVASVHAQSRTRIEATIPFDFTIGSTHVPAGKYSVRFTSRNALLLRSEDGKQSAIILAPRAIGGDVNKPERMVFHRYGDRYFLAQIWMLRGDSGRELDPSKTERALTKELHVAKGNAKPQKVEVAAVAR